MEIDRRALIERLDAAERHSFVSLYRNAPPELEAGMREDGPVLFGWMPTCHDPGFSGALDFWRAADLDATLERMIAVFREHGVPFIGLATHPHQPAYVDDAWFAERGFAPHYAEQVMWRTLEEIEPADEPDGVRIRRAERDDAERFVTVLNAGFGEPVDDGLGRAFAACIGERGWRHYLALVDGEAGAAAAMFVDDRTSTASFFAASTLPQARRRGAQTSLIRRRLADSASLGCEIAACQAVLDSASPRNFERQGFYPLYRRTIFAKSLADR
ncbi:MAG: hypothetical protein ACOC9Y_05725 [Chloroflexota bacterium]